MTLRAGLAGSEDLQQDRRGSAPQVLQDGLVGRLGVGLGVALAHVPAAGIPAAAADGDGSGNRPIDSVGAGVERLDGEAVARSGHQALVEVGALQDLLHEGEPRLARGGLELGGERMIGL